ncbi:conserved hypothetical protein [Anaeromyxobacter sp. K]|uniref:hypothetical protein n=1 Tax=Anaeromyxobacter sp. (strain K) TaxID=447217 RepID=UPI00015F9023|nr:hypothetical protein [Anaeromyxobacter sp. K]ACG72759.1 conserved hypothetical protein [Anaeromyxobacter sp. K]
MRSLIVASVLAVSAVPAAGSAQSSGATSPPSSPPAQQDPKQLEAEIAKELGAAPAPAPAPQPAVPAPSGAAATSTGGSPYARLLLLPDVSAIGSASLAYDGYDVEKRSPRGGPFSPAEKPAFAFEELELGLQAVVDPYVRADVFLSFTEAGAGVEEAYVTTLTLPAGLQVRAGRIYSPFGRLNLQHPHAWEFVDAPLARERLLGEESLGGPGVEVAWLAPLPWFSELRLAEQNTTLVEDAPSELTGVARLLNYLPLGETATLGLGLSAARRGEGTGGAFRDLGGADAYLRIRPPAGRAYLAVQGEVYARKFRGAAADANGGDTETGWWTQAFWRQSAWWGYGVRYERAPSAGEAPSGTEQRASGLVTWFPSEFQRLRLQVGWDRLPGGGGGLEALLHVEFGIGAHGAHPF